MLVSRPGIFRGSERDIDVRLITLNKKTVVLNLNREYHDIFYLYKK